MESYHGIDNNEGPNKRYRTRDRGRENRCEYSYDPCRDSAYTIYADLKY